MRFEVIALHWGVVCSFLDGIRAPLGTVSKDPSRQVNSLALFFVVPFILKGQDEEKQDGYSDTRNYWVYLERTPLRPTYGKAGLHQLLAKFQKSS